MQLQERRWNRRRVGYLSERARTLAGTDVIKTGSSQSKLWEPAFTPGGRGWGRWVYHQHISRAASVVSCKTRPSAFYEWSCTESYQPLQSKRFQKFQIWLLLFFSVSALFPLFCECPKRLMMLRLRTFLCTVAPIASHLVSGALLNQAIVERNALFKIPPHPRSKSENVWTQYKMKPIPYPFLFCHQAFSCGRHVLRCRDCSFVLHLCCVIKGPIWRTIHEYEFSHNNLWLQPVSELSSKEGSPSFLASPSAICWLCPSC